MTDARCTAASEPAAPNGAVDAGATGLQPVVLRSLPCIRCRYDLQGLPLRGACPECGTPVRISVAAVVDPEAENLDRLYAPVLTALGLLAWSASACLAAAALWADRAVKLGDSLGALPPVGIDFRTIGVAAVLVSGASAGMLIRPHRRVTLRRSLLTTLAVLLYVPLALVVARIFDTDPIAQITGTRPVPAHAWWRGLFAVLVTAIILLLRPPAVRLAMRSLVVRTGRVDRQPMWTLIPPAFLAFAGELMLLAGNQGGGVLRLAGIVAIVAGATLFTIGLGGILIDTWRLRSVIAGREVLGVLEALGFEDSGDPEGVERP